MTILFPASPLHPQRPDADFETQFRAAQSAALRALLLDSDALEAGDLQRALRLVRASDEPQVLAYRGWMLRAETYAALHKALHERNFHLLNDARSYALCHELPNWYPLLEGRTPRSTWLPIPECSDESRVLAAAATFGRAPLIVKDYVKSRKHEWRDACFIADASDAPEVRRVTQNFLWRQSGNLYGGLVLREFVPLLALGTDARTSAPTINEWRLLWLDAKLIACAPHGLTDGLSTGEAPSSQVLGELQELAARIASRFFAMDVAQLESGAWIVIELGDGGVSGLPPAVDELDLYARLRAAVL